MVDSAQELWKHLGRGDGRGRIEIICPMALIPCVSGYPGRS